MNRAAAALLLCFTAACAGMEETPPDTTPGTGGEPAAIPVPASTGSGGSAEIETPRPCWLSRHQSRDGSWDIDGNSCSCFRGAGRARTLGRAGTTGLALLAFLSEGETHRTPTYGKYVGDGLRFLKETQGEDGSFADRKCPGRARDHAVAALAMCEAYGLTQSPLFRTAAQRGVAFSLSQREPGAGWGREGRSSAPDLETSVWNAALLRSALNAGLEVEGAALEEVRAWVARSFDAGSDPASAGAMLWILYLSGVPRGEPSIARWRSRLLDRVPEWGAELETLDPFEAFFATAALFATSEGRPFPSADAGFLKWCEGMERYRAPERLPGHCDRGSWGSGPGNLERTALGYMTLEVFYR